MYPIQGTWSGEYSFNNGSEENEDVSYFHFELRIKGDSEGFRGRFFDRTLKTIESSVKGFIEDNFISFARDAKQDTELKEFLNFRIKDSAQNVEIHFAGNYDEEDDVFLGTWEFEVEEENEGLQESSLVEYRTGAWYMRKI